MHPGQQGLRQLPLVLANRRAEAHTAGLMANIPGPRYSGKLEELDEFERTWNKYLHDSTMGCSDA